MKKTEPLYFHIYKSSAGSGKTTALISVFLKLSLSSPNPSKFKNILAITFTNKAANELKERFISSLKKIKSIAPESSAYQEDFEVKQLLEQTGLSVTELRARASKVFDLALRDYDEIGIGTIDGFNHKLIRSFSRDLRLKADFEVELDEANLFADAVDLLLEKVGLDDHITHHLLNYLRQSIDDDKKAHISTRLNDLRNLITSEESEIPVASLYNVEPGTFAETKRNLLPVIHSFEKFCQRIGEEVFQIFEEEDITVDDLSYKNTGYFAFFEKLKNYTGGFISLHSTLQKRLEKPWHSGSASTKKKEAVGNRQSEFLNYYHQVEEHFRSNYKDYSIAKSVIDQIDLLAVLADLSNELNTLATERNVVPISSFNRIISNSMKNEPVAFIYEKYGNRYQHILIDEFQDTSELQWKNITPFIAESLSMRQFNMVVGDAKQSIYRWRGGKAEQLIRLPELDPADPDILPETRSSFRYNSLIVPLDVNFRSLPTIVEFNNQLIAELTPLLTKPDSLFRKEYEGKSANQSYPENKSGGYIEWHKLEKNPEPELVSKQVIRFIEDAVNDGFSYGDIAVLVRKRGKEVNSIIERFSELGIPFTTKDSFGLDMSPTVEMLLSFLRLSMDPDLAVAQIRAMREICRLHHEPFEPHKFWWKENHEGHIDFLRFAKKFSSDFNFSQLQGMSAFQICKDIIFRFVPTDLRRDIFIESLLNSILERGGISLSPSEYLDWWDAQKNKPEAKVGETGDQVQLMTIHKSKGLQFPVVILPNMNWKYTSRPETKWLPTSDKIDVPFDFIPLTLAEKVKDMGYESDFVQYKLETKFDNLNMIYVALTRPSQRLYICHADGSRAQTGQTIDQAFMQMKSNLSSSSKFDVTIDSKTIEGVESTLIVGTADRFQKPTKSESPAHHTIEVQKPIDIPLEERFKLSNDGISPNREAGVLFHELASKSGSIEEANKQLATWVRNGGISPDQRKELQLWIEQLFSDEKYIDLLIKGERLAERTLALDNETFRPDLVFREGSSFTVIDFKTGEPKKAHESQVSKYLKAVSKAENQSGKGFVVYLPDMKWVQVETQTAEQGTLF